MADDLISRSDALDERVAGSSEVQALVRYSHRTRLLLRWLAVSLAFDFILSVGLGYVAIRGQRVAVQANSIQERARVGCLSGNEFRKTQLQLWHYILDLPPTTPRTPAQDAQQAAFRAYVDGQFALRKC
jgi:hypothetical protein